MESDELSHLVGNVAEIKWPLNNRFFFPSKVGGKPAWLVPEGLPEVKCDSCNKQMSFLLQLYAPDADNAEAFHRSLMIFCCTTCRCFLKCFRSQLPLVNTYYPTDSISLKDAPAQDSVIDTSCCDSCGMREHQNSICRQLPEYGIEIEEIDEIDMRDDENCDSDSDYDDEIGASSEESISQITGQSSDMQIDESEADLFNDFTDTAIEHDSAFRGFKKFVEEAPANHIVYYSIGGSPVWITEQHQMPGQAPACEHCHGPRRFEFQIQPQLIYHLMKRLRGFPMNAAPFEWGVVSVYTCTASCSAGEAYKEEFVYNQLEPSEWLEFNSRKKVDFTKESAAGKRAPKISDASNSDDDGEWIS